MKQMGLGGTGGVVLCFGGLTSGQESVLGFLCALVPQLCLARVWLFGIAWLREQEFSLQGGCALC